MGQKILIIDDDPDIRHIVSRTLEGGGFEVVAADSGNRLDYLTNHHSIDMAIVDLHLPGESGLAIVEKLRRASPMGIIILTGSAETVDRVVGLEMGADDYVGKPFEARELLARVRAVLRRTTNMDRVGTGVAGQRFKWSGWEFDAGAQILTSQRGKQVVLTGGEVQLLIAFLTHPNRVLSRDQIIEMVSSADAPAFDRSIDVRIARLRKKMNVEDPESSFIRTVRNYGYQFAAKLEKD